MIEGERERKSESACVRLCTCVCVKWSCTCPFYSTPELRIRLTSHTFIFLFVVSYRDKSCSRQGLLRLHQLQRCLLNDVSFASVLVCFQMSIVLWDSVFNSKNTSREFQLNLGIHRGRNCSEGCLWFLKLKKYVFIKCKLLVFACEWMYEQLCE